MQVLHDEFKSDPAVHVVAVHANDKGDPAKYMEEHEYTYRMIPDGSNIVESFNVSGLPTFVVIDPDGSVVHTHTGTLTDAARDEIAKVAREAKL